VLNGGRGVVDLNVAGRLADNSRTGLPICRRSRRCSGDRHRSSTRRQQRCDVGQFDSHARISRAFQTTEDPSLAQAISGGDYLDILLAQRREIVATLPNEHGPALAALHRQLALLSKEIESVRVARSDAESVVARTPDEPWGPSTV
jgi:hypothetical protein